MEKIMKKAFTLAEVLITLGIIGIVAAMTLPALIQKNSEKEIIAKLKKFNSTMDQAFMLAKNENGEIETWGLTTAGMVTDPTEEEQMNNNEVVNKFWDIMSPYLKIISKCKAGTNECKSYERYSLDGTKFSKFTPYIILADGTYIVGTTVASGTCSRSVGTSKQLQHICGEIFVDVNGKKAPNKTGEDVFLFYYTKYGFVPMGTGQQTSGFTFEDYCNKRNPSALNGYGCTAWVIYNENMDYLHCNDLNWDGKKSCK